MKSQPAPILAPPTDCGTKSSNHIKAEAMPTKNKAITTLYRALVLFVMGYQKNPPKGGPGDILLFLCDR